MRRAKLERQRTIRVWRKHLAWHRADEVVCSCEFDVGRFRKSQRIGGCGNSQCYLCHADKLMKRPAARQMRSDASYREWMLEYSPDELQNAAVTQR